MTSTDWAFPRLQLRQLRHLQMISECGSIRRAANELSVTQPALSRSIRLLEEDLGFKLMNRGPRGVELTESGRVLVENGNLIEANLRSTTEQLEELHGAGLGTVRLGVGPYEGSTIAHLAIARLLEARPSSVIQVFEGNYESLLNLILAGEIDIMLGPQDESGPVDGLIGEILTYTTPVIAVRSQHPLANEKEVTIGMLANEEWVLAIKGHEARARRDNFFTRHGYEPPDCKVESLAGPLAAALLLERDIIALLPKPLISYQIDLGLVKLLPVPTDEFRLPVQLTSRELSALTPTCSALVEHIKNVCRELGDVL